MQNLLRDSAVLIIKQGVKNPSNRQAVVEAYKHDHKSLVQEALMATVVSPDKPSVAPSITIEVEQTASFSIFLTVCMSNRIEYDNNIVNLSGIENWVLLFWKNWRNNVNVLLSYL